MEGTVLKGAFVICEVINNLTNLKNNKNISGKELRLQLCKDIKICTENLTFSGMANLEENNIRRQYLSKILSLKLVPLTKDVSATSESLLSNNLTDKIDTIEKSEKKLQTYSNSRYCKKFKKLPKKLWFPKKLWKSKQGVQQQK